MHPDLRAAIGGSIAYEEYKGDYLDARRRAEGRLADARAAGDASALADALSDRGVVHLLQGEPRDAIQCLDEAARLTEDPDRRLPLANYRWLAELEQFNTGPDGASISSVDVTSRWDAVRAAQDVDTVRNAWRARARSAAAIADAAFVSRVLCCLATARHIAGSRTDWRNALQAPIDDFANGYADYQAAALSVDDFGRAAYAAWCEADLRRHGGDRDQASALLDHARCLYERADDPVGLGLWAMTRADWRCAPTTSPIGWNFDSQGSIATANNASLRRPPAWPDRQTVEACRSLYDLAERSFRQGGARRGLAALRLRAAYLAFLDGDAAAAVGFAETAIGEFAACGDAKGLALGCLHRIMARIAAGQPHGADHDFGGSGAWIRERGSFSYGLGLGFVLCDFGRYWLNDKGDGERAIAAFAAAEVLFESLAAAASAAQAAADQGFVFETIGERASALVCFERALDLYALAIRCSPETADMLRTQTTMLASNVCNLYVAEMDGVGIERSARRLSELTGITRRETPDALSLLQQALSQPFALHDHPMATGLASGSSGAPVAAANAPDLGAVFESMASLLVHKALDTASVLSPLYQARAAMEQGDEAGATRLMADATAAVQALPESERHFMHACVLAEQKNHPAAAAAFQKHIEPVISLHQSLDRNDAGGLLVKQQQGHDYEQAFSAFVRLRAYEKANHYLDALRLSAGERWWAATSKPWLSLSDCGEMYEGLNDLEQAVQYYDRAIEAIEARRSQLSRNELRTALAADKGVQFLYFQTARALFKSGDERRAFDYAERGKARALLDLMAGSDLSNLPGEGADTVRRWRQLTAQVALRRGLLAREYGSAAPDPAHIGALKQALTTDEASLATTEEELSRANPRFRDLIAPDAQVLSIEAVAGLLPADALLLEYLFLGEDMLAWAIGAGGLVASFHKPIDAASLRRNLHAFRAGCAERVPTGPLADELADTFFEPFDAAIRDASQVVFVPYGAAHQLPFHALPFDGEPLNARRAVSSLPSASTLRFLRRRDVEVRVDHMLAVGNPTGDLPAAAIEASSVAGLFNETALIGAAATEAVVRDRIRAAPLLHFATHARLSEVEPLRSSIVLADGEELTVYEMMGLRLDADLVVLSACDTGRGKITGGDDVVGLTRGLLAAGARSAVVSLWPVEDVSTSLLMEAFYRGLIQYKGAAARALAEAQSWLREGTAGRLGLAERYEQMLATSGAGKVVFHRMRYFRAHPDERPFSHPYYWAGFIYIGI
jgi:Uncharacterized protein conserved in bacteria